MNIMIYRYLGGFPTSRPDLVLQQLLLELASEPTVLHLFAVTILGFVDLFVFRTG